MEPLPSFSGVLVEPAEITVTSVRIGALPLVNMVLERLGLLGALEAHLPTPDRRSAITSATALRVLICNLCVARQPLYALGSWAAGYAPGLLGLGNSRAARVNDDRVGRALDQLFCADRASLLTELTLRAVRRWGIDVSELHNDSTSITLYGSYRRAIGTPRGGNVPPIPQRGHSKDHRPDLLQLVEILTVSADATIPIAHRLVDGSTEDSTTHEHTWDQLAAMFGASRFVLKQAFRSRLGGHGHVA